MRKFILMWSLALLPFSAQLVAQTPSPHMPSADFIKLWQETESGFRWASLKHLLDGGFWLIHLLKNANYNAPDSQICLSVSEYLQSYADLGENIGLLSQMSGLDADLEFALQSVRYNFDADAGYLAVDPIRDFCIEGRKDFGQRQVLIQNLQFFMDNIVFDGGHVNGTGVVSAFKNIDKLIGLKSNIDEKNPYPDP